MMIEKERGILKRIADMTNPYSWITGIRNWLFDRGLLKSHKPTVPTICIGNISVGGTGKTPHTEYLVRLLMDRYHTAVISRGYGRRSKGFILADNDTPMTAIGDEPFQIKNKFRDIAVAVCERRTTGINKILSIKKDIGVILLDDAFQHRHVKAGLNILLIDCMHPIWQDCILPFGRLRESAEGIRRADIVIITKCCEITDEQKVWCRNYIKGIKDIPVFFSKIKYGTPYPLFTKDKREISPGTDVLLVTGIASPGPLENAIRERGTRTTVMRYADHHNFTATEMLDIEQKYNSIKNGNKIIVTTEKDATRILQHPHVPERVKANIHVLPIEVEILNGEKEMFNKIILDYVTENSRNS